MTYLRPLIGIINLSSKISDNDAKIITSAIQHQLTTDIAPKWNRDYWFVIYYPDPKTISPRAYPVVILDSPDAPNALGYHSERSGKPYGRVFVNPILENNGDILYGTNQNPTVSSVLSHEVAELFVDPYCNLFAIGPRTKYGPLYCYEAADPVQSDLYQHTINKQMVSLSNFILPAWFDNQNTINETDFLGKLKKAPFTISVGGYAAIMDSKGTINNIFGEIAPNKWVMDMKELRNSRKTLRASQFPKNHAKKWWQYLL